MNSHRVAFAVLVALGTSCGSMGAQRGDRPEAAAGPLGRREPSPPSSTVSTTVSTTSHSATSHSATSHSATSHSATSHSSTSHSSTSHSSSGSSSASSTEVRVDGGSVVVRSLDGVIEVLEVVAAPGWEATWDDAATDDLTVSFTRGGDRADVHLRLTASGGIQQSTSIRTSSGESAGDQP